MYAGFGEIGLYQVHKHSLRGVEVAAFDEGPGIDNIEQVLNGGFSTSGGLGLGLSGLKHIVDEFWLDGRSGEGTRVFATVWSEPTAAD